ncbi:MAG: hypothetical protein WBF14_15910, partial [Candidatus Acidiferrales bacterium]
LRLPNIERGYRLPATEAGVLLTPGTLGRGAASNKVGPCRPQRTLGDAWPGASNRTPWTTPLFSIAADGNRRLTRSA